MKWIPNEYENDLIKLIQEAERYCKCELEMYYDDDYIDQNLIGWYARDYKEYLGGSFSINENGYDKKPLISDTVIQKYNINVRKCFDYCNVYVCG